MSRRLRLNDLVLIILMALFIFVCGLFVWSLVRPSPPPPDPNDTWVRVQEQGKMVVGTSADYPPFAYYNDNYQLDGFDVALIREIGQRLGVQVEIRDMAFAGLGQALAIGQIDAAISAISITDEREQAVDFSAVYFVGEDAVLARPDAAITINQVEDIAPYRVGVQAGSVYERNIQQQLIATGRMAPQNLYVYAQADTAVADLSAERVDLVWLDLQPAEVAAGFGNVRLVGQGLARQRMAIAVQNGQAAWQAKLNETLTKMQNEGRIAQLVLEEMGIPPDQILPPPTPAPTGTPVPTATPLPCVDGMRFVQDLNLDDNNMTTPPQMPPGVPFRKGWLLQNTGTCTWDSSYYLGYVDGNNAAAQMGGQPTHLNAAVPPGATAEVWVDLVTPLTPGTYQGFWALHNGRDQQFGDRIWVGITVVGPATATPPPTQTPSPNISFTVDQTQIQAGACVLFNWNVVGATAVYFYAQGQPWQSYPVPAQGSRSECPPFTTVYELRVAWPNGATEIKQIQITVIPAPGAPVIERFTVYPPVEILAGQCVDINWAVSGQINNITLLRNDAVLSGNAPISGGYRDCPDESGEMVYGLVANGNGGTSRAQHTINVILPATEPPPPTATPPVIPPVVDSFWVRPEEITEGQCVDISWHISGQATLIQVKRDGLVVLDNAGYSGVIQDCLNAPGTVVYRIEAQNQVGDFAFQESSVLVQPDGQPGLPLVGTDWVLTEYWDGRGATVSVIEGTEMTAVFREDGQLTGSAGCNTYSAGYTLFTVDGSIAIEQPTRANLFCTQPAGVMEQEATYFDQLVTVTSYQISGDTLELVTGEGRVVLRYQVRPQAVPFSTQ